MQQIYLDNAATTGAVEPVAEAVRQVLCQTYGNPSSVHGPGAAARSVVDESRDTIARILGVDTTEIVFTSGGTEANNIAIRGVPRLNADSHAILSAVEHPSVYSQVEWLQAQGVTVDITPVNPKTGSVELDVLLDQLKPNTRLIALMAVNNETGSVQPIASLGKAVRAQVPDVHIHCDAVQAFGKHPVRPREWDVNTLSISAHKIHGPKGIGALYLRRGKGLNPLASGGSQEGRIRPGTENVPGIAGFGAAARHMQEVGREFVNRSQVLRDSFLEKLESTIDRAYPLVDPEHTAPYIIPLRIEGCSSETLLHFLEREGVIVSSGSACHGKTELTHVIKALGYTSDPGVIRVSLSPQTPEDALDFLLAKLQAVVGTVRQISKTTSTG
ncbi:MAG: cysteine desulfurase NifS [Myxococcales bacterium]|nr:cysteine desulfurase NifS [Myxococcales bacterium]